MEEDDQFNQAFGDTSTALCEYINDIKDNNSDAIDLVLRSSVS